MKHSEALGGAIAAATFMVVVVFVTMYFSAYGGEMIDSVKARGEAFVRAVEDFACRAARKPPCPERKP
jgi:hypothetical protein